MKQGDVLGSFLYALSIHPAYQQCTPPGDDKVRKVEIMDDLNLVGAFKPVLEAFDRFEASLVDTGLEMRRDKCRILWPHPTPIPEDLQYEAEKRQIKIETGAMTTLGAMVGLDQEKIMNWVAEKVAKHKKLFDILQHAEMPSQISTLLLRMSALPSMGYLSRTIRPHLLADYAKKFDLMVLETAVSKLNLPKALSEETVSTLHLPLRLGGFGLRSVAKTSSAAYFSAVAQTVPDLLAIVPANHVNSLLVEEKSRIPTANAIQSCLEFFAASGLTLGQAGLPRNLAEFWGNYSLPTPGSRLQSAVCTLLESVALAKLKAQLDLHNQQRIVSAGGKFAGVWLSVTPTSFDLQLTDEEMGLASRIRLGLPPLDNLPVSCVCGQVLDDDPDHFLSCQNLRRSAVTSRHDSIVRLLAKHLRRASALVHEEQRFPGERKLRPDLDVFFSDEYLLVDVVVTHPAAPSRKSIKPLAAAGDWERRKVNKYESLAAVHGAKVFGFSLESIGAWSGQAVSR